MPDPIGQNGQNSTCLCAEPWLHLNLFVRGCRGTVRLRLITSEASLHCRELLLVFKALTGFISDLLLVFKALTGLISDLLLVFKALTGFISDLLLVFKALTGFISDLLLVFKALTGLISDLLLRSEHSELEPNLEELLSVSMEQTQHPLVF